MISFLVIKMFSVPRIVGMKAIPHLIIGPPIDIGVGYLAVYSALACNGHDEQVWIECCGAARQIALIPFDRRL
jgi:hypothetical protein